MRSRIMIVGRDVTLRARLARLLNGGRYHVEIAENAEHARRVGLEGVALAIVAPEGVDTEGKGLVQELRAAVGAVLLVATPDGRRELRSDVLDVSDEAGLLARVAEALAPAAEADEVEPALHFAGYRLDLAGHALMDRTGKGGSADLRRVRPVARLRAKAGTSADPGSAAANPDRARRRGLRPQHRHADRPSAPQDRA